MVQCNTTNGLSTAIASNILSNDVTYERNFVVVINGAQTTAISNTSQKSVTISNYYPNGSSGGSGAVGCNFTANANTKFENISFTSVTTYIYSRRLVFEYNGTWYYYGDAETLTESSAVYGYGTTTSGYFTQRVGNYGNRQCYYVYTYVGGEGADFFIANGNNLILGRGISGTISYLRGIDSDSNTALDYTIRLESGTVGTYAALDNSSHTLGSTVSVRSIFGCDYDRAKNDNTKLSVAPNGTVYGGDANQTFTSSSNRNNITYDWIIKSGKVQKDLAVDDASAEKCIYMGNSISGEDGVQYNGRRRLTMKAVKLLVSLEGLTVMVQQHIRTMAPMTVIIGNWQ